MKQEINSQHDLDKEGTIALIFDYIHRLVMHHAMWYAQALKHLGKGKADEVLKDTLERTTELQLKRLSKTLGFSLKDGLPEPLLEFNQDELNALKESIAFNWLANDGIWFQAVEFSENMVTAKQCNDACWGEFSPFEAWSIKRFLHLPENAGLEGLKKALQFRLYATINQQSFTDEGPGSFTFRMNNCRVQAARKRKGLEDYPCKSGGLIEYTTFANGIDPAIKTECIGCPPDKHPEDWYCAWRFSIAIIQ
jgi:hypothetical protein